MKTMSKRMISLLLCFAMVLSLGMPAVSAVEPASNLLVNGTFDTDVSDWDVVNPGTTKVGWTEYNPNFPDRGYFEINGNMDAYATQTVTIPADGWYELSALICGGGFIELLDAEGNVLSSAFSFTQGAPYTVAADAVNLKAGDSVTVKIRYTNIFGGWLNIDDVTLITVDEPVDEKKETVYLSELYPVEFSTSWGKLGYNAGVGGSGSIALFIDDSGERTTFEKGIAAHAASKVVYDIEGMGVEKFTAWVGVNQDAGMCGFYVYTDLDEENALFSVQDVKGTDKAVAVDVAIPAEATQLILVTDKGTDNVENSDHSVWADAKLTLKVEEEPPVTEPPVTEPPVTEPPVVEPTGELVVNGTFDTDVSGWEVVANDNPWSAGNTNFANPGYAEFHNTDTERLIQAITIPESGWYQLSGLIAGSGILTLTDAEGETLTRVVGSHEDYNAETGTSYAAPVYLEEGAVVTLTVQFMWGGNRWSWANIDNVSLVPTEGPGVTGFIYLSDVEPVGEIETGWSYKYDNSDGYPIQLYVDSTAEKTVFQKGLYANANSKAVYDLTKLNATRFQTYIGVSMKEDSVQEGAGTAGFQIYTDASEEPLYSIDLMTVYDEAIYLDLEIPEGATTLTLITTDAGIGVGNNLTHSDHSVWADAKFIVSYPGEEPEYVVTEDWQIVNGDNRENWSIVDENTLSIDVQAGDIGFGRNDTKNFFLTGVDNADFTVSVKMEFQPDENWETAGLAIFVDDFTSAILTRRFHSSFGNQALGMIGADGNFKENAAADPVENQGPIWLKINKTGNVLTFYWSADGETWNTYIPTNDGGGNAPTYVDESMSAIINSRMTGLSADQIKVGLYTGNSVEKESNPAVFSDFTIEYADGTVEKVPFAKIAEEGESDPHVSAPVVGNVTVGEESRIEAELGKTYDGANKGLGDIFSGGAKVGNVGNNSGAGRVEMMVYAAEACTADLDMYYVCSGSRDFAVKVNDGEAQIVTATGSSWGSVNAEPATVSVKLEKGNNLIAISGNGSYAPDLDYVVFKNVVAVSEPESVEVTLVPGVTQSVTIPAGGNAIVTVDATASSLVLNVTGNRTYWNWNVQAGKFPANPGPGGFVEVELPAGQVYTVLVNNLDTEVEAVLDMTAAAPVSGTMDNPAELVLGENTAAIEAGSQGYFYTWTAPEAGTLTITMPEGDWMYAVNNLTSGAYGDTQWSDSDPVVNPAVIEVAAGDELQIMVNSYDPNNMWGNPAAELVITAAFAAEGDDPIVEKELIPADGWTIVNENGNLTLVDENTITIATERGDFAPDSNAGTVDNYWLRTPADKDFTLTVKLSGGMYANYQKAGIMVFADDQTVASVVRRYHSGLSGAKENVLGMFQYLDGYGEPAIKDPNPKSDVLLKLVKTGSTFEGFYSFDEGETWTEIGTLTNETVANSEFTIGVFAAQGTKDDSVEVTFSNFTYNGTVIPFAEEATDDIPAESIKMPATLVIDDETVTKIEAEVLPTYATDKTITWTSSNESVATIDDNGVITGVTPGETTITAKCGEATAQCVVTVNVAGQILYVSDMNWVSARTDWQEVLRDIGVESKPISLLQADGSRISYEKAVAAHAFSEVVIDIEEMGVQRFVSDIGVNQTAGSCGFIVMADDQVVFQVECIKGTEPVQHVDVEIPAGTKTVTLKTTDGNMNDITSDHSIWAGAHFVMDTSIRNNLRKVTALIPGYMAVDATAEIAVSGELVKGTAADLTAADIIFESSDEDVVAVDENGTVTAKADGVATVTVTVTLNGITKTASTDVIVGKGAGDVWSIASPDGELEAIFMLDANGTGKYMVLENGVNVIESSDLGLVSSIADFTEGLEFVSVSEITEVVDEYDLYGAKVDHVKAVGNEMTLTFEKVDEDGEAAEIKVVARMYNDGLAFRYVIDGEGTIRFTSESTTVKFPAASDLYAMIYIAHNEAIETHYTTESISGAFCEPLLYQAPNGTWVLLSEAALNGNYCGTYFNAPGDGTVNFHFSKEQSGQVISELPFESPWRFAVVGTAEEINLNTMAETLCPDAEGDFSWVQPGVTAWTWLNRESTRDGDTYLRYVDFAAEMGWEYLLLDEGWQPSGSDNGRPDKRYYGYFDWFPEVLERANEKGVKLILWANHNDLKDDAYREELFAEWESMGIAGLKPDFFDRSSQEYMKLYDEMIADTAKYHLALNLHGMPKPSGERRTYPHLLTREGVFGHEQELFLPAQVSAYHNIMLCFVRNAIGPADYTPMFSYQNSGSRRNFSLAHMAAMAVAYESGIQCLADRPDKYQRTAESEMFFRDMPAAWNNSFLPVAEPGEKIVMVRQNGDDFYVGGMTVEAWEYELDLSFLTEGKTYYGVLLTDGETVEEFNGELLTVTSETKLPISMLETGGFALRLMAEDPSADEITLDKTELIVPASESASLKATVIKGGEEIDAAITWTSSDETVATVSGGTVTGVTGGTATITATITAFDGTTKSASCEVTVTPATFDLEEGWTLVNGDNREHWDIVDENTVTVMPQYGDYYISGGNFRETAKNIFMHDVEAEDFEISVEMEFQPTGDFATAGLLIYAGGNANFALSRRYHSYFENETLGTHGVNGTTFPETHEADPVPNQGKIWLKIVKSGTTLTCYWSADGETWTEHTTVTWTSFEGLGAEDIKVGLYNGDSLSSNSKWATFSNFTIKYAEGEETLLPFAVKNEVPVYGVELDKAEAELEIGDTLTLTANTFPANADNQNVTWSSSDESVATVVDGVVTAVAEGEVTITVTTEEGEFTAECVITVNPAHEHTLVHIEAVEPGCHYNGNIEYWFCTECELYWQDEALTQLTNSKRVILPATGSENVEHVEAKEPTHTENGNIEYWYCPDCEQYWQDEALTQLTNSKNVILPAEGCLAAAFSDVNLDAWYHDPIDFVLANGMMTGDKEGTFRPDVNISRAQVAQILYNMAEDKTYEASKTFSDVKDGQWFYDAVMWAAANGFVLGDDGADTFRPDAPITRQELVVIIWRYMGKQAPANAELTFADAAEAASWAVEPIAWATENGFVNGMGDNKFAPKANASRAQMTQILMNIFG